MTHSIKPPSPASLLWQLLLAILGSAWVAGCVSPARGGVTTIASTQPYPGITQIEETRTDPPLHLHIVKVDLTDPHVHVISAHGPAAPDPGRQWEITLQTVRATAQKSGLVVAVNGDFFMPKDSEMILGRKDPYFVGNWANVCGWAMSGGELWSQRDCPASLVVDEHGHITIGKILRARAGAREIVSGQEQIVIEGRSSGIFDAPAPRTAAGTDRQGKQLVLLVADGRRPRYSAGLSLADLGDEMKQLGCYNAIGLDGGGSSTMVVRNPTDGRYAVLNRPSDGHDLLIPLSVERPVANVLGIRIDGVAEKDRPAESPASH